MSLKQEAVKWEHVAIPFDEPLECTCKKGHVVLGPWFEEGAGKGVIDEAHAQKSVFTNELQFDS